MKVLAYKLINPEKLVEQKDAIRSSIIKECGGHLLDFDFYLSDNSGCFKIFNNKKIWKNKNSTSLPNRQSEIINAIVDYFRRVNQTTNGYREKLKLTKVDLPDLFPIHLLKHLFTYPMIKSGDELPDHWISNWMMFIPCEADEETNREKKQKYPVYGGTIEVRIGSNFQIIGLISNIRPWVKSIKTEGYFHKDGHDHEDNKKELKNYFFVADAPNEKQNFLAPFYNEEQVTFSHHSTGIIRPACAYSVLADIGIIKNEEVSGITLFAMILDKEGNMVPVTNMTEWKKDWLYKEIGPLFFSDPIKSKKEFITLESVGVYHVELVIEHIPTGVCRTTYKQVIVGGAIEFKSKTNLMV